MQKKDYFQERINNTMKTYVDSVDVKFNYNKVKTVNGKDTVYVKKQLKRHHAFNSVKKARSKYKRFGN